jgi:AcrR family transcriptional regulator
MMEQALSRREESKQARRAAIVAVARDAFLDHGYAATSVSSIAAMVGGSKATLWAYFPTKEDLFGAVVDEVTAQFRAALEDALRPGRDQRTTLTDFSERFLAKLLTPHAIKLHRLIVGEGGRFPEVGRLFFERGPKMVLERLGTYLDGEMTAGRMRRDDSLVAAERLIELCQMPQLRRLWGVAPAPDAGQGRYVAGVVDFFLRGYAPMPA